MPVNTLAFVRDKLRDPAVSLTAVAEATGISRRSLELIRGEGKDNAWSSTVEALAAHFGYRFEAVPIEPAASVGPDSCEAA